ncbi:MAG: hypothetical protein ACP5GD_01595 [Candidatus Micrarchaeia archaeon]
MFGFGSLFHKGRKSRFNITSIKINYMGAVHEIAGFSTNDNEFEVRIPFKNRIASDLGDDVKRPELKIDAISVGSPFELLKAPDLPIVLPYGNSTEIVLKIRAPGMRYTGPLFLNMLVKSSDLVHIGISVIRVSKEGKSKEIPVRRDVYVAKSDTFKQEIDLSDVVNPGETVNAIKASPPFEISSTLPSLPFSLKEARKVEVYIKAPSYNYSGPIELSIA